MYRRLFPGSHPDVATGLTNVGRWLTERGDYDAAESMVLESLAIRRELLGDAHPRVAVSLTALARLYLLTGRVAEAESTSRDARLLLTDALSAEHWRSAWAGSIEGASLTKLGKFSKAEPLLLQSHKIIVADAGARPVHVESSRQYLADLYQAWGRPEEAARYSADTESGL